MRALDGPAQGVELSLRRCPTFLRLVQDETTLKWDALDQLDDTPGPSERIHVYQLVPGTWAQMFACGRGRGQASGRYEFGDYRRVDVDGERFRETQAWRDWAQSEEAAALLGASEAA